jgi:hypothetical protein
MTKNIELAGKTFQGQTLAMLGFTISDRKMFKILNARLRQLFME